MSNPPRYPIEVAKQLAPKAPARIGGRVIHQDKQRFLLADATGQLWVSAKKDVTAPALGEWVVAEGKFTGDDIVDADWQSEGRPTAPFPVPDGDWLWLRADHDRRLHALRDRARVLREVRAHFDDRAFLEVETPMLVKNPGMDAHLDAFGVPMGEEMRWLITSPEYQMKRLLAGGMARIYQLAKCFRKDECGHLHQPEFTMLEWYRAFAGSEQVMEDTETLVAQVATAIHGRAELPAFGKPIDVSPPWDRMTVAEAFHVFADVDVSTILPDEEAFFRILIEKVEPRLGSHKPVFLTHWPASMASLARLNPEAPTTADRFEAYIAGVELCNGFGELTDPVEQRSRFEHAQAERKAMGKPVYPIDEPFMRALEEGLPTCGGNALGIDRLVMLTLGASHIDDVLAVPHGRL